MLRFAKHLNLAGLSLRTIRGYYRVIDVMGRKLEKDPATLEEDQIRDYFVHVKCELKWEPKTIRQLLAACKHFYRGCLKRKLEILDTIKAPDREKLPEVLSQQEVIKILGKVRFRRYRTPLLLCYSSGLRIGECIHLQVEDIQMDRQRLFIRNSKGGKDHYTILTKPMYRDLQRYWLEHKNPRWLFPEIGWGHRSPDKIRERMHHADQPMGKLGISNALAYALKQVGIRRKVSCHTLRHSFATHLLEAGVPITQIQEYLGHASVETTSIYAHLTNVSHQKAIDCIEEVIKQLL